MAKNFVRGMASMERIKCYIAKRILRQYMNQRHSWGEGGGGKGIDDDDYMKLKLKNGLTRKNLKKFVDEVIKVVKLLCRKLKIIGGIFEGESCRNHRWMYYCDFSQLTKVKSNDSFVNFENCIIVRNFFSPNDCIYIGINLRKKRDYNASV